MHRERGDIPATIRRAVHLHCRECNDAPGKWDEARDCGVWRCWLYPYRPGSGGEERKVRVKSPARVAAGAALARKTTMVSQSFDKTRKARP